MRNRSLFVALLVGMLFWPGAGLAQEPVVPAYGINEWGAAYWNNTSLNGPAVLVRNEAELNYNWGGGSPGAPVNADSFSARWARYLELPAGTYRFTATSDDGMRVFLNGTLIIDEWYDQEVSTVSVDRQLAAGYHLVVVEYYEHLGDAVARFAWGPVGQIANWRGEYYGNKELSGSPMLVRDDGQIQFNWGGGAPAPGMPADHFSVRWTRQLDLGGGTYRFAVTADDGVRLWVNNQLVIDAWHDQPATTYQADVPVPSGKVPVRLEYFENLGDALVRLDWAPVDQIANWRGEYFANKDLAGSPAVVRDDAQIQFKWGAGAPAPGLPADRFSVRWTRRLSLDAGTTRFTLVTDDGARLWVNNQLVIDAWRDQPATTYVVDIYVPAGGVPVKLEYYDNLGEAVVALSWRPAGQAEAWRGDYFANKDLAGSPAMVRDDAEIQFAWGTGSPAAGTVPKDRFSVRWTRRLNLAAGTYRFTVVTDDGVRLWVNNQLLVDEWHDQSATTYQREVPVPAGGVPVKLEYYENTVDATIRLSWAPAAQVHNWRGQYYANPNLAGPPALVRDDAQIQFKWGPNSPAPGVIPADHFSVRWTRGLKLDPGTYQFKVTVDDGVRLWVNDQLVINSWRVQAPTTYYATVYWPGGTMPVQMEYFENTMGATAMLSWVRK